MLSARESRDLGRERIHISFAASKWLMDRYFYNVDWPGRVFANNGLPPDGEHCDKSVG
jgi:hypothetical protein